MRIRCSQTRSRRAWRALSPPTQPAAEESAAPTFGQSADSGKPLDEVILEYLVDKARERSREQKDPSRRQQRPKE